MTIRLCLVEPCCSQLNSQLLRRSQRLLAISNSALYQPVDSSEGEGLLDQDWLATGTVARHALCMASAWSISRLYSL